MRGMIALSDARAEWCVQRCDHEISASACARTHDDSHRTLSCEVHVNALLFALLLPASDAAPGFERGAREHAAEDADVDQVESIDDERRGGAMLVGAAFGALSLVIVSIGAASLYEAHADATVPPAQQNPDAHVTPLLFAFYCSPLTALVGAGAGAGVGWGVDALVHPTVK
jgi:hypothetical protein